jgi:transcriptional regulator with XRE-family HTH domain
MANPEWFGARLRELREAAGLTQQQLADKVGCTWQTVSRWERGQAEPGWTQILAISESLNISCEEFRKEPAEREPSKAGRPPKEKPESPRPRREKEKE